MGKTTKRHFFETIAPLLHTVTERFFDYLSWLVVLLGIDYLYKQTGSVVLHTLHLVGSTLWMFSLILQTFSLTYSVKLDADTPSSHKLTVEIIQYLIFITMLYGFWEYWKNPIDLSEPLSKLLDRQG